MNDPAKIEITKHAAERYIERVDPNLMNENNADKRLRAARKRIRCVFKNACYISDDEGGILFRNYKQRIGFIIKNKTIISTLVYQNGKRKNKRKQKQHL